MNLAYKSICVYAHKGGVGKSFLTLEMAVYFARQGKNVFIIDADSQLNLTTTLIERESENRMTKDFVLELLNDKLDHVNYNNKSIKNLYHYLKTDDPLFDLNDFIQVKDQPNIRFLMGTPILSTLEVILNLSITGTPGLINRRMILRRFIVHITTQVENSVVLIDLSPSASLLNQMIMLSCDNLIIPNNPDNNSIISLSLLLQYLPAWKTKHDYLTHTISLLAIVLNRYKVAKQDMAKADNAFYSIVHELWMEFQAKPENAPFLTKPTRMLFAVQDGMRLVKKCSKRKLAVLERRIGLTNIDMPKLNSLCTELEYLFQSLII